MKTLDYRLNELKNKVNSDITIMILGLGSVGTYLLDYLMSTESESFRIIVVGRNYDKIISDVNIVRVAALIRNKCKSKVEIEAGVDFENVDQIVACIQKWSPDFIVNTSRVYAGLKYGSISWHNVRAYGIWTPLAIKYIKNIMEACEKADSNAITINTSYSDAVIPWLKTAGKPYPDFGSGNLNHLIPRIKYAISEELNISDFWNINVEIATAHFHDVVVSKEGHTEGVRVLMKAFYNGVELRYNEDTIWNKCKIAMPIDAKRNMMNASSNYDIIMSIISALKNEKKTKFYSPGAMGEIGGYPVCIDGSGTDMSAVIDQSAFSLEAMRIANRESIALDGVENVENGVLIYTDELIDKVKKAFDVDLPKQVDFSEIDCTANWIIKYIIEPQIKK